MRGVSPGQRVWNPLRVAGIGVAIPQLGPLYRGGVGLGDIPCD